MASKKSSSKPSTREGSSSQSSSKKQDATKTPSEASKSSKIEHRRPAVMPGDLAGAEYNPARTEEGDRVAQTGMNPRASRAGLLVDMPSLATVTGGGPAALGLGDIGIQVVDGSRWSLSLGGQKTTALRQEDAGRLIQQLQQIVQETT
jgi:hypothetical protein